MILGEPEVWITTSDEEIILTTNHETAEMKHVGGKQAFVSHRPRLTKIGAMR
jgi:hypothetical protein